MPKYSIIVPVYNCRKYLPDCVESILDQTVPDFELLLVDDGATDGSSELCDACAARDRRILAFHKQNGGAASARNLGLDKATGQYAVFVDGDDLLEPDTLEQVTPVLKSRRLVIYGMSFDYYSGARLERTELLSAAHVGSFSKKALASDFQRFFEDNALSSACNKVFDLELIRANGLHFPEGMTLYEDYAFVLRYLAHVDEIYCLDQGFYHYRLSAQESHLHGRVYHLDRLEWNMNRLMEAAEHFGDSVSDCHSLNSSLAGLYLQLLSMHLLMHRYSARALEKAAVPYCANENFRRLLEQGGSLSGNEAALLRQLDERRFSALALYYRKRALCQKIRKAVKNLIKW